VLDVGAFEMIALVVVAIMVFGPDKLPKAAADAARLLRQFRRMSSQARADLKRGLGPEFQGIDLHDLNPRTFLRHHVLSEGNSGLGGLDFNLDDDLAWLRSSRPSALPAGERPPYDPDAT